MQLIDLQTQYKQHRKAIDERIAGVLEHGKYIMGPEVGELEDALSQFTGAKHVITCSNGTDAIMLGLIAAGVGRGDCVFVPSFTFVSTAEVVAHLGAIPVLVDVKPDTYLLDTDSLNEAIKYSQNEGMNPRAIIAVDLFGQPADYNILEQIARENAMFLLADAAQSFGAVYRGDKVGTLAPITATSFFPAKPLGCYGDGGALFTDNDEYAEILCSLRVHGKGSNKYDNVRIGINGRLDTLQAAILLEKLKLFPEEIRLRQKVADHYSESLKDNTGIPFVSEDKESVWAQYTIRHQSRDRLIAALSEQNIPSAVYYPKPLHLQTAYNHYPRTPSGLKVSEGLSKGVVSLPMHPYLSPEDQEHVINAIISFESESY